MEKKPSLTSLCSTLLHKILEYVVPMSYASGSDAFQTWATLMVHSMVCKFLNQICKHAVAMRPDVTTRAMAYQDTRMSFSHETVVKSELMRKLPWVKKTSMFFDLPSAEVVDKFGPWYFVTRSYDRTDVANWCVRHKESSRNIKRKRKAASE